MYKIFVVDIETQNNPWYGNVASAFNPDNYIVAPGWRVDTVDDAGNVHIGETRWQYFNSKEEDLANPGWFDVLNDPAVMIMVAHNAAYELKWFLTRYRTVLEGFFKRGGRIACTALAEYLLSHQQELYPSLDETAVKHGGTHKVDGVKVLWEQGYLTSQIDKALLIEYLAGPSGDIDNTALTFYSQQQKLAAAGMDRMYWERCDALLAFAYCEWFGLYVDRDVAEKNRQAQEAEIAELQKELYKLLPDDLPEGVQFNWGSDYHMSALVYGGPVKYRHRVPYDPPQYVKADFYQTETDGTLVRCDDPLLDQELVAAGQHNFVRFKSGKNKGQVKVFREDTDEIKTKWEETSVVLPGLVNVNSLPDGIKEKYIGKRAEFRGARTLCDGTTPVYSTSTEALKGLKNFVPEVGLMVKLAALEKDVSTYYWRAEYATEKPTGKASIPEAVVPRESREGGTTQSQEAYETQVRVDVGAVAIDAHGQQPLLPDMLEGSIRGPESAASIAGCTGPLPRDGEGTRSTLPHLQQSIGDGRGQSGGPRTFREIPKVGVDGCTKVKGMMQYIGPDGIVHHSLNVTATVTTRLSSNKPNLQNLPRDGTSNVKEMFTSRFGADGRIVEVDYSALEVVMLCAMTKDTDLLALLQAGTDMHCYRLAFRLGEPYEDVMEKCHNENHPQHKEYKQMRTDIKPLSFADQYGATAGGIAFNVGCTVEFAEQFQENEMKMFPISRGFRQVIADEVERTGALPSGIHREMGPTGMWQVYRRGYYKAPSTTCYSFRQQPQWDKDARQEVMKYKATQMANYPFQGEAGFMMSVSMGRICRWLIHNDWFGGNVCLINNVHDAVYGCCKDDMYAKVFAKGAKEIMENAPRYMTALWPEYDMAEVPFPAAAECGPNMQHKTHMELNEDYPDWVKRPVLI